MKKSTLLSMAIILALTGYISLTAHMHNKIQHQHEEIIQVYVEVQELRYKISLLEKEIEKNNKNNLENACLLK